MNMIQKSVNLERKDWDALEEIAWHKGREAVSERVRIYIKRGIRADLNRMEKAADK